MVRPNSRALVNFSMYFHISTGVNCDVKHNTMPQNSCGLHESGAGGSTLFSTGYTKFYLHFYIFLTILIKLATEMSTKIYWVS